MDTINHKKIRTRFAPSPTGSLHIGGLRTALFSYLFAKKHGGEFILRIEDTDRERFVPGAQDYILRALSWCGIVPDEGILSVDGKLVVDPAYVQSLRNDAGIYRPFLDKLILEDRAYYAFDRPDEVEAMKEGFRRKGSKSPSYNSFNRMMMRNSLTLSPDEVKMLLDAGTPYVVRMKMPQHETVEFTDMIRGKMSIATNTLDDKVLWKSDGMPTYHLANVVDDMLMGITHVIRGEEWLPSASTHQLLHLYLGNENIPEFAHLPLILKPQKDQLEKMFADDIKRYDKEIEVNDSHHYRTLRDKTSKMLEDLKSLPEEEFKGKLSKRDGDRFGFPVLPIEWKNGDEYSAGFREDGFLPESVVNILAHLGWNPGKDVSTLEEMAAAFDMSKVSKSPARFDLKKAYWINKQVIQGSSGGRIAEVIEEFMMKALLTSRALRPLNEDGYLEKVCDLMKQKVNDLNQIWNSGFYFFVRPGEYAGPDGKYLLDSVLIRDWNRDFVGSMLNNILNTDFSVATSNALHTTFDLVCETLDIDPRVAGKLLRVMITDTSVGPPIFDIMLLLGKAETVLRIENCIKNVKP